MTNEEAIKVMNTIIAGVKHNIQLSMTVNDIEDACYMAIEVLKERPQGKWIEHDGYEECSECHNYSTFHHPFCPNCGFPMKNGVK